MSDFAARLGLSFPQTFVEFAAAECDQPIHQRFQQQTQRHPDACAVRLQSGDISYAELNAAANRAARLLLATLGVGSSPVALMMDQGYESIVWTLASLKAGLCYAPIDQRLPPPVLDGMIKDLTPEVWVASPRHCDLACNLGDHGAPVIPCDATLDGFSSENLDLPIFPESTADVFYTSGSTGTPKGVADSHRNLLHNILRYTNSLKFAPGDILSLVQNPSFSGTVSSLFGALLNGAAVAPFDLQGEGLHQISQWLQQTQVSVFHAVPSIFRQLSDPVNRFPSIRLIRLEGDRATPLDIKHFRANFQESCTLVNGLGATECGLVRQFFIGKETILDDGESLPIGYPVTDMTVRVVDERGRELPFGAVGEIVVESRFLATGYWRNAVLTAARFVAIGDGLRCYRTGDLGRMSAAGCLFHLGRVDQRLRIGGEFMAAADVEKLLLSVSGVRQAAVRDFLDRLGERRLCAYLVADADGGVTVTGIRQALSERIAPPHLPTAFIFLDALPLTKDLKIDFARLPQPAGQRPTLANDYVAPETEIEQQMARIWSEVLEIDPVGVTDSFFDLGGDSLRAARFVTLLREKRARVMQVSSLFQHRTIRELMRSLKDEPPVPQDTFAALKNGSRVWPEHSIAIIGMAGRFPGADTLDQFWDNLRAGCESISCLTGETSVPSGEPIPARVAAHGLLSQVDQFDAALFRLTPRQAQMLDPQQRLWLECVHQALEDAGLLVSDAGFAGVAANVGVFVGGRESTYLWHLVGGNRDAVEALLHRSNDEAHQLMISNDTDSIATRTSFLMGFTGPSINIQTACSTSLVAVAQACQALVNRHCDIGVAGGVAVTFPQQPSYRSQEEGGIHSHDGHCRAFDAGATGTVFGDGVGVVVLKRLDDALCAGDRIEAVLRGWAVNNDGSNKASFAAPSVKGQAQVIIRAQDHARVRPHEVSYVEAHGTGTPVGDPIEFAGLERAFRRATNERGFCALGSVKTNIGHLDTAAGIAALIKTVLALKHREIPPTLHFQKANPEIDLAGSPFYINDRLIPWMANEHRVAGVSSFGVGGTNCHVILQEAAPPAIDSPTELPGYLLTLSAVSEAALQELETRYQQFLAKSAIPDIASIAATTQRSRSRYSYRTAIVGNSADQLRNGLSQNRVAGAVDRCWRGKALASAHREIGFLFAGQGSQYADMGRELYQVSPEFRRLLELCDEILRDELERPLLDVMFDRVGDLIHRTEYAQPALIALEYSLAELLRSWGIIPKIVMGHSIGEYAAACIAGVFTLEEGLRLAAARGRLMQRLPGRGKMLAVTAEQRDLDRVLQRFQGRVSIAALNSPTQTVLSGEADAIDQLKAALQAQATYCRELAVSHAFHSAQMNPALAPLRDLIGKINLRAPTLPLIANLHGRLVTTEVTDPQYWSDQARQPVQFAAGIRAMIDAGCELFVEIGPDAVCSFLSQEFSSKQTAETIPTLRCGENDWTALLATLARLYVRGVPVNWAAFQKGQSFRPVRLPSYPLQRARYWYEGPLVKSQIRGTTAAQGSVGHPLLGRRLCLPGSTEIRFESRFSQSTPHYLNDHRLFGVSLPPAASHFAMLAQATEFLGGGKGDSYRFEDLYLLRPLLLQDGCERDVQLIFQSEAQGWSLELTSAEVNEAALGGDPWTPHMIGLGRVLSAENIAPAERTMDLSALKARCARELSRDEFYSKIWANQGGTGSAFRWIESIWQGDREALCQAACPPGVADAANYRLHPGLIEAACQALHCCAAIETEEKLQQSGTTFVPFSVDIFSLFDARATHGLAWCYAQLREHGENNVLADLSILNAVGELVAQLTGFRLRPITRQALGASTHRETTRPERQPQVRSQVADFDKAAPSVQQILRYLQSQCAELSGYPESEIGTDQGFMAMGLDSMVAMILANRIRLDFGCAVPVTQILMSTSIASLAQIICGNAAD